MNKRGVRMLGALCLGVMVCLWAWCAPAMADPLAEVRQADLKVKQGDYTSAIQLFNQAIRSGELSRIKLSGAHFRRGVAFGIIGDTASMKADMAKAVELNGDNAFFRMGYGSALYQDGQVDKALEQYRAAARLEPTNPLPVSAMGVIRWDQGNYEEAEGLLKSAAALKPKSSWEWDKLGSFYLSLGRYGAAKEAFVRARKLAPDSAELALLVFIAKALDGQPQPKALKQQAAKLAPGVWPEPAFGLFLGRLSAKAFQSWLKSAGSEYLSGGLFFLAQYHFVKEQDAQAVALLKQLAHQGDPTSLSRPAARAELRRRGLLQ